MPAESWPCGATTTTTSGRIPHWAIGVQQKRAGRLSNLRAPRPARLPNPKPTTINPKDSRYERGTTGGQVKCVAHAAINLFHAMRRFGYKVDQSYALLRDYIDHKAGTDEEKKSAAVKFLASIRFAIDSEIEYRKSSEPMYHSEI